MNDVVPLWMLIGLPGSGKSTWAYNLRAILPLSYVSTDQIRGELFGHEAVQGPWDQVWERVTERLQEAVGATRRGGFSGAIYDATNTRRRGRRVVIRTAQDLGFTRVVAVWLDTPLELCLVRNQQRSRQVPPAVIETMSRQLAGAPPHWEEGFAAIYRLLP